jgi:eukaryotic-like serine/threonine-protein kinase
VATICESRYGGGATWNRDGVIVFAPGLDTGLFRVAATGGTAAAATVLDPAHQEAAHYGPLFLPDGRHFLFSVFGGDTAGAYIAALDSPVRKRLSLEASAANFGFSLPDFLYFTRNGTLTAQRLDLGRLELAGDPIRVADGIHVLGPSASFAVSASGALSYWAGSRNITQLTWFQRNGTSAGTLGSPAAYMNVALSSDGRQAAVDRFDLTPGIWLLDATRGTETRATFGNLYESTPVWSPDAGAFAFAAGARHSAEPLHEADCGSRGGGTPVLLDAPEFSAKLVS